MTTPTRKQMQMLDELVAATKTTTTTTSSTISSSSSLPQEEGVKIDVGNIDAEAEAVANTAFDAYDGALNIESRQF
ncbi:detonator [Drosophila madeirensis]|uniref:Detonator n=1 Tax=Drosophila madeirensis TaxID=30013 RepID=A0AAU9FX53_DROMD